MSSNIHLAQFARPEGIIVIGLYLLALIVSLYLWYVWLVLPLTLSRRFDELLREQRKQTALLERIVDQTRPPGAQPSVTSGSGYNPLDEGGNSSALLFGLSAFVAVGLALYLTWASTKS